MTSENPLNYFSDYHLPFIFKLFRSSTTMKQFLRKEDIIFKKHLISIPFIQGGVTTNACEINLNLPMKTRKMSPNNSPPPKNNNRAHKYGIDLHPTESS